MRTEAATVLPFPSQGTPEGAPAPRAHVRLEATRRGRMLAIVVAFLLGLLVAATALVMFDIPAALAGTAAPQPVTITVEAGDTLWGYAEQYAPEGMDAQEFIAEVRLHNQLPTGRVTAGQQIELPFLEDSAR